MTREEALKKLDNPAYDPTTIKQDFEYIAVKLGIDEVELEQYFTMPKKFYWDYKNQEKIFNFGARVLKSFGLRPLLNDDYPRWLRLGQHPSIRQHL